MNGEWQSREGGLEPGVTTGLTCPVLCDLVVVPLLTTVAVADGDSLPVPFISRVGEKSNSVILYLGPSTVCP